MVTCIQWVREVCHDSEDVRNIHGRNFDYTFVLDCDSREPTGVAHTLLLVAAGRPDKAIIQSAIKLEAGIDLGYDLHEPGGSQIEAG